MKSWSKRIFSGILAVVMLLSYFPPMQAMAAEGETDGLYEHHLTHEACGYVDGETPCSFVCEICAQPSEKDAEATEERVKTEPPAEQEEPDPVPAEPMGENVSVQVMPQVDLPDNAELFAAFAERELYGYEIAAFGTAARENLNPIEQKIYDDLKSKIETVALNGGSTVFSVSDISGLKTTWTNTELGVSSIDSTETVKSAFLGQFNLSDILRALLSDCPFDLYWYDKTVTTTSMGYTISRSGSTQNGQTIWNSAKVTNLTFTFSVSADYDAGANTVTSNVAKVTTAKNNAAQVVVANASKSDVEKMKAFKEYICSAVTYNHGAADDKSTPYGDPWQLISVFDGDSTTNVVCEGYAKAFQYLCDLSGLDCVSVSGTMTGGTGSGGHMWNVVTLEGKKYLVDVTNCDEGTVGEPDLLFLVGAPYANGGYSFDCGYQTISFLCTDLGLEEENYAESQQPDVPLTKYTVTINASQNGTVKADLTTAVAGATVTLTVTPETGYALKSLVVKQGTVAVDVENNQFIMPAEDVTVTAEFEKIASGTCGNNLTWEIDETTGTLTISGNGAMDDYTSTSNAPWYLYGSQVKELVIENGVTRIGDYAFHCCKNLDKVSIPASIEAVGQYTFASIIGQRYYVIDQTVRQWSTVQEETQYFPNWETTTFVNPAPIIASGLYGEHVYWELDESGEMVFFGTGDMYDFGEVPTLWGDMTVKSITIEEGITRIGHCAFEVSGTDVFSKAFESVTIPSTVTFIGGLAFSNCKALGTITFTGDAPTFNSSDNTFNGVTATAYYPANNPTWTSAVMQNYGGNITWKAYCLAHGFGDWITTDDDTYRICEYCGFREDKVNTNGGDVEIESSEKAELNFDVEHVESDDDRYVLVEETVNSEVTTENEILKVFDITLKNADGVQMQPDGMVKVKLPLDWDRAGNYKVYRVNDDGTLTDMNAYQQGSHMVFETDHFSLYVIVETSKHSHQYQEEVTPPTCTAKGYTTHTCKCGNSYVDNYVEAAGHSYDDNVDGTCNSCDIIRKDVEKRQLKNMLRMYNPYTGEHFYTGSEEEKDNLVAAGWKYEGVAFTFPANTGAPVYRLYDPATGEHLYTMDEEEKERLMEEGWNYENIAFNSAYDTEAVQHRLHNPYASVGAYHFTYSEEEKQNLINAGWEYEGIGWYSCFN